jgi:hypothetical protein
VRELRDIIFDFFDLRAGRVRLRARAPRAATCKKEKKKIKHLHSRSTHEPESSRIHSLVVRLSSETLGPHGPAAIRMLGLRPSNFSCAYAASVAIRARRREARLWIRDGLEETAHQLRRGVGVAGVAA